MLDHAVDDHSLNPLNLVRHRNFQLVQQYVRHDADKATWIVPDHALERRATVLLPLGINIGNKGLAELVARTFLPAAAVWVSTWSAASCSIAGSTITHSSRLISCVTATSSLSGRMLATRRT
jgi:hypothetical protein